MRPLASVSRYRGEDLGTALVARELLVDALVLGSRRQHGENLSFSVALVDACENRQACGHRYQGRIEDILTLQDEFATDVASNLRLQLTTRRNAGSCAATPGTPRATCCHHLGFAQVPERRWDAEVTPDRRACGPGS